MARTLTAALRDEFTNSAQARGDEYAETKRVRLESVNDDGVAAVVQGTRAYAVDLSIVREGGVTFVGAACDCPFHVDQGMPCKHMWAVLVAAERGGRFTRIEGPAELVLPSDTGPNRDPGTALEAAFRNVAAPRVDPGPLFRRALGHRSAPRRQDPGDRLLSSLERHLHDLDAAPPSVFRYAGRELFYVFVPPALHPDASIQVHLFTRSRKHTGEWTKPKPARLVRADVASAPAPDRSILARLFGGAYGSGYSGYNPFGAAAIDTPFALTDELMADLLPAIADTGRALLQVTRTVPVPLDRAGFPTTFARPIVEYLPVRWDDGPPWRFTPTVTEAEGGWRLDGRLTRDDAGRDWLGLADVVAISNNFVWTRATIAPADLGAAKTLALTLATSGAVDILASDTARLAAVLAELGVSATTLPDALHVERLDVQPVPHLRLRRAARDVDTLVADLRFAYGDTIVPLSNARTYFDADRRRLITRHPDAEVAAEDRLADAGFIQGWDVVARAERLELPARRLPVIVPPLLADGWRVEADGGAFRPPGAVRVSVVSGIDWFDLDAAVEFGDTSLPLIDVVAALQRSEPTVQLGDGTVGILPDTWLRRYLPLAAAGEVANGRLRFRRPQAALLDALLADAAEHSRVDVDEGFRRARDELARVGAMDPVDPPPAFTGVLREYQREGLAWLQFLQRSGFGGCLADDMGLGKTVMVLALLVGRRDHPSRAGRPSVVVVPRSLVHNWMSEADRFAPTLRVMDFSTATRRKTAPDFRGIDIVLTTYGTLRQDALRIKDVEFDYVILDEAQAIKNATTASAKAVRLLHGRHRLALTGTPIENHLGEVWSLFEFLNPGVLGRSSIFQRAASAAPDADAVRLLARGLRPFLLRRTKQQVASELPAKTEQTITCELSRPERALYDSLRRHYHATVLARVERDGITRSQMHILEALLRLRQAACHPALVDRTRHYATSAKLEVVLAHAREVIDEGHKAIVFSQFTSLLALLRQQLDRDGITYEYLDGRTKRRGDRVARFQDDPDCRLFLISLKAGGVGLNLTAAEYVFLLDPWWNPAVEAQAIDRAHRIGQTREVFAYRLVAGDTIESKILELQERKRALADAVLGGSAGGLKQLDRKDLELLLS